MIWGNLIPGGFTGITLLIQQIGNEFLHIIIPYTVANLLLNAVPVVISFKFIGKKFTVYSCFLVYFNAGSSLIIQKIPKTDTLYYYLKTG